MSQCLFIIFLEATSIANHWPTQEVEVIEFYQRQVRILENLLAERDRKGGQSSRSTTSRSSTPRGSHSRIVTDRTHQTVLGCWGSCLGAYDGWYGWRSNDLSWDLHVSSFLGFWMILVSTIPNFEVVLLGWKVREYKQNADRYIVHDECLQVSSWVGWLTGMTLGGWYFGCQKICIARSTTAPGTSIPSSSESPSEAAATQKQMELKCFQKRLKVKLGFGRKSCTHTLYLYFPIAPRNSYVVRSKYLSLIHSAFFFL